MIKSFRNNLLVADFNMTYQSVEIMNNNLFFVINSLHRGGAERVVSVLANEFDKKGFNVVIICLNKAEIAFQISPTIKVVHLILHRGREHLFNRVRYGTLTYLRLFMLLTKQRPACVLSFMTAANLWAGLACSLKNIPFIVSERTTPDRTINSFNFLLRKLSFRIYRKSRAIVVPAKGIADCIIAHRSYKNLNNFKVIRNPINIFPDPSGFSVNKRAFILGVGRLDYVKGFDLLIDAYSRIATADLDLLIVGDGKEYSNLKGQIEKLGMEDRIKLIGAKNNLQDYYQQAEIFVLPSRNEGYPNALIEAMSFGCACVAVDCDFGPSEIIEDRINGILVSKDSLIELSDALTELMANRQLRKRISENAQLISQTNCMSNISTNWQDLIFNESQKL